MKVAIKHGLLYGVPAVSFIAALIALLYMILKPYSHQPEDGLEDNGNKTSGDMQKPDSHYDLSKRGYRNNNPLNIRISANNWKGEIKPSGDKSFCQFETMAYGFRAALVCIRTYITKHKCQTLQAIINRWAPWTDGNNPVRYAQRVMDRWPETFPSKEAVIDYTSRDQMTKLVYAMAIVENGSEPLMKDCELAFTLM